MKIGKYIIGLVVVIAVAFGANFYANKDIKEVSFGATSRQSGITVGNDGYSRGTFSPLMQSVGLIQATSTTGSSTATFAVAIPAASIQSYQGMIVSSSVGSSTFVLPASSTLSTFLPIPGQIGTFYIHNATGTAGVMITASSSAGISMKSATTSLIVNSGAYARIELIRQQDTNFAALVTIFR